MSGVSHTDPDDAKIQQVARSYVKMFLFGISLTGLAIVCGWYLNTFFPLPNIYKTLFEYFGYICWCTTLGESGLNLFTWGRRTRAEFLDRRIAQVFSLLGVFAFVLSHELK